MNKRITIGLAIVNAALLAFILIYERGTLSTGETAGRSGQVLRTFIRDRVERVELVRGDEPAIAFVRERDPEAEDDELGEWVIREPIAVAADADAVDSLLSELEWLGATRTLEGISDADRESFGLTDPRFVVRYTVIESTYALRVGGEAPTGNGVYVAVDGEDTAYVVSSDLVEALDHDVDHFRNKELFDGFYTTRVERVRIDDVLFEKEDDIWRVREPIRGWANVGLVDRLMAVTRELNATRFIAEEADDPSQYGLDAPWHELTVIRRAEEGVDFREARLRVGAPCAEHDGERYARAGDDGPVVCVNVSDVEDLVVDPGRLREQRLLALGEEAVESFVLTRDGARLEVEREEDSWKLFTGPEDDRGEATRVEDDAVAEWTAALRDSGATAFETLDDPRGTDSPWLRIVIERRSDRAPIELAFGDRDADGVWVRRGDEDAVVRFDASLVEDVDVGPLRFRARDLFEAEAADVSRITLDTAARGVEERAVRGSGGTWRLEAPVEAEADRVVVSAIGRQLSGLRAERFVAASPSPEHGLSRPTATIAATFTPDPEAGGEPSSVTVRIGAETDGGAFAQLTGDDAVFVLSSDRVDALTRALVSLDALTVDADTLESLRLERGEEAIALVREGTTWLVEGGAAPDEERTRALMDRLGTLRALGVAEYGEGAFTPQVRVVATRRATVEGDRVVTLDLGDPVGEGDDAYLPVRRSGLDVVYRVRPDMVRSILGYAP